MRFAMVKSKRTIISSIMYSASCTSYSCTNATQQRLGKNPEDYPDAKNQPHVQVALRMKQRGGSARHGDVIPYIFCLSEGEEPARSAQADRAKHPDELRKAG